MAGGSLAATLPARPGKIMCLVYCAADRLATGGSYNTIRIWDTASGGEILQLAGHTGSVTTLVYDPGNQRLISGSYDTTVRFWATAP
jgi:WD40 repeat protein